MSSITPWTNRNIRISKLLIKRFCWKDTFLYLSIKPILSQQNIYTMIQSTIHFTELESMPVPHLKQAVAPGKAILPTYSSSSPDKTSYYREQQQGNIPTLTIKDRSCQQIHFWNPLHML